MYRKCLRVHIWNIGDDMKSKILIALLLISVVALSGCAAQPPEPELKSQEEVQQVVTNVTENIGDVQDTLQEIDDAFG